jgi:hypothetical protein
MRKPICRFAAIGLIVAGFITVAVTAFPQRSSAGTLSTAVIGMFPKDVGEFAYADLKSARKYSWFPQLRDQLLPSRFRQFEQFLSSAGIDPNTQVEELAWGGITVTKSGGEAVLGIALGSFDPPAVEMRFKQQKMPTYDIQGYHLYSFGSGIAAGDIFFLFLDSNTAAFGHRAAMEELINVRLGMSESLLSNGKLYPLVNEANGSGMIWAVLDQNYTHLAMQQLVPQASQFPDAAKVVDRMQAMTINVVADNGIDAHIQAVCGSVDDANLLGNLLQAAVMYRHYQEAQTNSPLAATLDQVRVTPSGDRIKVDVPVTQDQLLSLIQSKAFSAPM